MVGQVKGRQGHEGRHHFSVETHTDQYEGEVKKPAASGFHRMDQGPGRQEQYQDQAGVRVVVAVHRHADGGEGHHQGRGQGGPGTEPSADQVVNQNQGAQAFQHLGKDEAKAPVAEELRKGRLNPQGNRGFVHGDETNGVEGNKEEIVPIHQHAADAGGVIGVAGAVLVDPPEAHKGRRKYNDGQQKPFPKIRIRDGCFGLGESVVGRLGPGRYHDIVDALLDLAGSVWLLNMLSLTTAFHPHPALSPQGRGGNTAKNPRPLGERVG